MAAIGIDTHKRTLAACAVDAVGGVIDERTFDCDPAGFVELAAWAGGVAPEVRIGIEGSASYGAPVAHHLIAAGFCVREVPPHLSRRERARTRRPGKSDPGDALAIARVTMREPDLPPVRLEDRSTELGLLADARAGPWRPTVRPARSDGPPDRRRPGAAAARRTSPGVIDGCAGRRHRRRG